MGLPDRQNAVISASSGNRLPAEILDGAIKPVKEGEAIGNGDVRFRDGLAELERADCSKVGGVGFYGLRPGAEKLATSAG